MHRPTLTLLLQIVIFSFLAVARADLVPEDRFQTTSTMQSETKLLVFYLEQHHYLGMSIQEIDPKKLIQDFLYDFDVNRLYLLNSDVKGFEEIYGDILPDSIKEGSLDPAFTLFLRFRDRVNTRVTWILDYLAEPIRLDNDKTYSPDRKEAEWPATLEAANELWDQRLKFEILNEFLANLDNEEIIELEASPPSNKDTVIGTGKPTELIETALSKQQPAQPPEPNKTLVFSEEIQAQPSHLNTLTHKYYESIAWLNAKKEIRKRYERIAQLVAEIEPTEVQEVFLTTLTHQYDPHSTYMSPDTLEQFAIAIHNSLVGIGALLSDEEGYCTIQELLPGGPAKYSRQLEPGDQIVGVAQGKTRDMVDIIGMKLNKIVKMIRGKQGSTVRLLIKPAKGDPSERRVVSLVRDEIKLTARLAKGELVEVPSGDQIIPIGVIHLPAFYGSGDSDKGQSSTTEDVKELLLKLEDLGAKGIVLDLRNNGGGLLSEAIDLTGLFIPVGPVVQVKDYTGRVQEYLDTNPNVVWDGPLMLLLSRYSASASEITAGALKNHGRALIVGDTETHGKGTVQAVFEMNRSSFLAMLKPKRGAAKITIQKYYLPDGTSTQINGVPSDIILPSLNEYLPIGEGDLPNALDWDRIDALEWDYDLTRGEVNQVQADLIHSLRQKSLQRQKTLEEFDWLNDNIDWFRLRQEQKEFSLNLDTRQTKREADLAFRNAMKERLDQLMPTEFDSEEILLQVSLEQQAKLEAILATPPLEEARAPQQQDTATHGPTETLVEVDEDTVPDFDIHLRESLRIMADWIKTEEGENIKTQ